MNKITVFLLIILTCQHSIAQTEDILNDSVEYRMIQQLSAYPQEKIYMQTDKSVYLSGERVWFRTHLVDALTHKPIYISRYVYVELINPLDNLVRRVKIRPDSTGSYSGYLDLEDDLVQGNYTFRAYTHYMRNMGEESLFKKTIQVLDPYSLEIEPIIGFDIDKNNISLSLQFVDRKNSDTIFPEVVECKIGHGKLHTLRRGNDGIYQHRARLSEKDTNRTLLLSIVNNGRKYSRYYNTPTDITDYDIKIFPEGGYLIPGVASKVAFKAQNSNGMGCDVEGIVYDSGGKEITKFNSKHLGMGYFHLLPLENETYHIISRNINGTEKRTELPTPRNDANVISAKTTGDRLLIQHHKGSASQQNNISLLIHHKGLFIYKSEWKPGTEIFNLPIKQLPTGILNILLINHNNDVLSERLIFNLNSNDFASIQSTESKQAYKRREQILVSFKMTDFNQLPSTGNIALSVTDKNTVELDSTINIISTILLSSELKGHLESPASYFSEGTINKDALDVLMLTQGWKRYNIPSVIKGDIETPDAYAAEKSQIISGRSETLIGSLKEGKVSMMAKLDSLVSYEATNTDDKGRFTFNVEYPEGTTILVQTVGKRGGKLNVININQETYPQLQNAAVKLKSELVNQHSSSQDSYLQQANEEYTLNNGLRTILLDEITVTAQRLENYKESIYYSPIHAHGLQTAEDIEKMASSSFRSLLYRTPGIIVRGDQVTTTRSELPVLFIIDNMTFEDFSGRLDEIDVSTIESIFVLRDNTSMPGYFPETSGAVVVTSKMGNYKNTSRRSPNIDEFIPLGYQQAAEFYSPTYETEEQKDTGIPDLRTTIYWKPNLQFTNEGEAVVEFYSADYPTTYQMIGEGIDDNGKLVRFSKEFIVESSD